MSEKDIFTRDWIISNAIDILDRYEDGVLTIRGLHYQLVGLGMTNTQRHYKRVVASMGVARRNGRVSYSAFSDNDREVMGETKASETDLEDSIEKAKGQIRAWMKYYSKNRWENQPRYVEVFIEKKALQGVFGPICSRNDVALSPCKGYPSLTFLHDASERFVEARDRGQKPVIVYFGDYDPSGEDIPRSIGEVLERDFGVEVEIDRRALMHAQVIEMNLPPAPAKDTDSRTANWDGIGQVELDAVKPEILREMASEAILNHFDEELYSELQETEEEEREQYVIQLKEYVQTL